MSFQKFKILIDKLSFDSFKITFNSLIEIRTKLPKSKNDIDKLIQLGVIPKLLLLLKADLQLNCQFSDDEKRKITDIVFSILGNLCMQGNVRKHVQMYGGVDVIANHLCESESECIQNRSCRALANLALDPSNCFRIHKTEAVERIVHLLESVENKDCLLTFCRAIRLIGHTVTDNEKLLQANAVTAVAKLIKSSKDEVRNCSLRTINDLSKVSCCSSFASQVLAADVLEVLLKCADDPDNTISQHSMSILFQVMEQENIRPAFGAAGGISYFIDLMKSANSNCNKLKILNVICLCCKEAVNRVKIRELGGLQLLLDRLSEAKFRPIHSRIISTFLCFLYDEHSFNILLENGLILLLVQHMRKCIEVDASSNLQPRCLILAKRMSVSTKQFHDIEIFTFDGRNDPSQKCENLPSGNSQFASCSEVHISRRTGSSQVENDGKKFTSNEESLNTEVVDGTASRDHLYRFSVNSPTYRAENDWNIPNSSVPKCKQSFYPIDLSSSHSPSSISSFSPLSSVSYYSNEYSPSYSPDFSLSSPVNDAFSCDFTCSSPIMNDTGTWSPPCPTSVSPPLESSSPMSSSSLIYVDDTTIDFIEDSEITESKINVLDDCSDCVIVSNESEKMLAIQKTFSEKTEPTQNPFISTVKEESTPNSKETTIFSSVMPSSRGEHHQLTFMNTDSNNLQNQIMETVQTDILISEPCNEIIGRCATSEPCNQTVVICEKVDGTILNESDEKSENTKKRKYIIGSSPMPGKKRKKVASERCASDILMERNILMILSRASQMSDPIKHLVTPEVISCLLDYMSSVESIDTRSCRLFSRLLRNPLCFDRLMDFHIPLLIYSELLIDCSGRENFKCFDIKSSHTKMLFENIPMKSIPRSSSVNAIHFESLTREDVFSEYGSRLRTVHSTSLDISMESVEDKECSDNKYKKRSLRSEDRVGSDITHHALGFLECLSFVLNSRYGRGVVAGFLKKVSVTEEQRQWLAVCIPFLCWNREMQHYFLIQMGILEELFHIIEDQISSKLWQYAICSLSFLGKLKDIKLELNYPDINQLKTIFVPHNKDMSNDLLLKNTSRIIPTNTESKCIYQDLESSYDLIFVVGGAEVKACRDTLIGSNVVFSAMLSGQYTESSQSKIRLKDTPPDALLYILHYLYGCDLHCDLISEFLSCPTEHSCNTNNIAILRKCLQVISMADKYLLIQLSDFIKVVVISRFLTCETAVQIYHFADFHQYSKMALDSLKCILVASRCPSDILSAFFYCLQSSISHRFLDSMKTLVTQLINPD